MSTKIDPNLIQLTHEAALYSFWRKQALKTFLRASGISEQYLSTFDPEETKRDFLGRTFLKLQNTEAGKTTILKMAETLSAQETFPDLKGLDDSEIKIERAKESVTDLKNYLLRVKELEKRENNQAELRKRTQQEKIKSIASAKSLASLSDSLTEISSRTGEQKAGYEFESWVFDLLELNEIECKRSYISNGRQIDRSITLEGTTYLLELKNTTKQSDATDIDIFKAKVDSKADNTMGIFVSMSGYSSVAISEASGKKTTLLLLDASHVYLALGGQMQLKEIIKKMRRHASQTGESYLPASLFWK